MEGTQAFGALGKAIGDRLQAAGKKVPYLRGLEQASLEELKSLCASLATYGGTALFHMQGVTPEAGQVCCPPVTITIGQADLEQAVESLTTPTRRRWILSAWAARTSRYTRSSGWHSCCKVSQVRGEFWITTARPIKQIADRMGYTAGHRSQRGQVRRRYLLRGRPDPGTLPRHGDRQRQSLLLCQLKTPLQNAVQTVR